MNPARTQVRQIPRLKVPGPTARRHDGTMKRPLHPRRSAAALGLLLLASAFVFPQPASREAAPATARGADAHLERARLEQRLVLAERTVSYLG